MLMLLVGFISTLFVVGLGVAAIFAQGIYSPSKVDGDAVMAYEKDVAGLASNIAGGLNETLLGFESASHAGLLRNLSPMQWTELNSTVSELGTKAANVTSAGTGAWLGCVRARRWLGGRG